MKGPHSHSSRPQGEIFYFRDFPELELAKPKQRNGVQDR